MPAAPLVLVETHGKIGKFVSILNRVGAAVSAAPIISCDVMFIMLEVYTLCAFFHSSQLMVRKSVKIMVLQTQIYLKRRSAANN